VHHSGAPTLADQGSMARDLLPLKIVDDVISQLLALSQQLAAGDGSVPATIPTAAGAERGARWSAPSQTLIFLDWDDTLFPSTALFDGWGLPSRPEAWAELELTEEQEQGLARWREVLASYLRVGCSLSTHCVILTNSKRGWVDSCIDRFAPNLRPIFNREDGPRVVYAMEELPACRLLPGITRGNPVRCPGLADEEQEHDEKLKKAKFMAMQREAKEFYTNILSIGDSRYEHDAAQDLAFRRPSPRGERLRMKTLTTPVGPPLGDLTYRLRLSTLLWPTYVNFNDDLDLDLNTADGLQAIARALGIPGLRSLIRPLPVREDDEEALAAEFDKVAVILQHRIAA